MKNFMSFFLRALPLSLGLILCLTALSFLVSFTGAEQLTDIAEEGFLTFVVLSIAGIPTLLFGIIKLSNESAL